VSTYNIQPIIDILAELANRPQFDAEEIDEAIDALESIKGNINADDDEAIDKVDEIQDYLQYLLIVKEPCMEEVKEELSQMISDVQHLFGKCKTK